MRPGQALPKMEIVNLGQEFKPIFQERLREVKGWKKTQYQEMGQR